MPCKTCIADPEVRRGSELAAEKALEDWMVRTHDPLLEVFRKRDDAAFREAAPSESSSKRARRARRTRAAPKPGAAKTAAATLRARRRSRGLASTETGADLIELEPPTVVARGEPMTLKIKHHLPDELGERPILVTLKDSKNKRIDRKTLRIAGTGEIEVVFDIPEARWTATR